MAAKIVTYPGPPEEAASSDYTVTVNGEPVFCYTSYRFNKDRPERIINGKGMKDREVSPISFAYFDFEGEVTVSITAARDFSEVAIRPLSLRVEPKAAGNVIRFTLNKPGTYIVEPYGPDRPIHIFANPLETNVPDPADSSVRYFPPGIHYIDPLSLNDNETVYIAGGAIVYANIQEEDLSEWDDMTFQKATFGATGKKSVKVTGRGIVCGRDSLEKGRRHKLLEFTKCEDVEVDGVILRESSGWSFAVFESKRVSIDNVRIVGHYINNDGIDICSSRHVRVKNCFCHNADDSFLIKAHHAPVDDVVFENCVAWNDVATSFGIVCETAHQVTNVFFRDCTVVHSTFPCWIPDAGGVLAVWNDYGGDVQGIHYENIVIEDACADKQVIKLNITNVHGLNDLQRGSIRDISFRNVEVLHTKDERIAFLSPFEQGAVSGIVLERVAINGKPVNSAQDSRIVKEGATDIRVRG